VKLLKVNLRFFGAFATKVGRNSMKLETRDSATLADLLSQIFKTYKLGSLNNSEGDISAGYLRIYVNGRNAPLNMILQEDDEISFLSPVAGG
jgi:molybdopterin converting factor small subunit